MDKLKSNPKDKHVVSWICVKVNLFTEDHDELHQYWNNTAVLPKLYMCIYLYRRLWGLVYKSIFNLSLMCFNKSFRGMSENNTVNMNVFSFDIIRKKKEKSGYKDLFIYHRFYLIWFEMQTFFIHEAPGLISTQKWEKKETTKSNKE